MTANELKTVFAFERGLKVGDPVEVRWTNSFRAYRATGTVAKVNANSFRVKVTDGPYETASGTILVPRFSGSLDAMTKWSINNCVCPVGGFVVTEAGALMTEAM